jgi:hypothetical protein
LAGFKKIDVGIGKNATQRATRRALAKRIAKVSGIADLVMVGPFVQRSSTQTWGVCVVFSHRTTTAGVMFVDMASPPNDWTREVVLEQTRENVLRALKHAFREVKAFPTNLELAEAATAKWPCARTTAFVDSVRKSPEGFKDIEPHSEQ